MRVINRSYEGTTDIFGHTVEIHATDDSGWAPPSLMLDIAAKETVHLNSRDIEEGNASKGLTGAAGSPTKGHWRLRFVTGLDMSISNHIELDIDTSARRTGF
ncbi:MAG: hypothetical protein OXQ29_06495 [Rhodospirillaceae bacterium]|nr:hypothetical protein [Rhodospirillaceae bacterium]